MAHKLPPPQQQQRAGSGLGASSLKADPAVALGLAGASGPSSSQHQQQSQPASHKIVLAVAPPAPTPQHVTPLPQKVTIAVKPPTPQTFPRFAASIPGYATPSTSGQPGMPNPSGMALTTGGKARARSPNKPYVKPGPKSVMPDGSIPAWKDPAKLRARYLKGLDKRKCKVCPYYSCKKCCMAARNPCVIHVLKTADRSGYGTAKERRIQAKREAFALYESLRANNGSLAGLATPATTAPAEPPAPINVTISATNTADLLLVPSLGGKREFKSYEQFASMQREESAEVYAWRLKTMEQSDEAEAHTIADAIDRYAGNAQLLDAICNGPVPTHTHVHMRGTDGNAADAEAALDGSASKHAVKPLHKPKGKKSLEREALPVFAECEASTARHNAFDALLLRADAADSIGELQECTAAYREALGHDCIQRPWPRTGPAGEQATSMLPQPPAQEQSADRVDASAERVHYGCSWWRVDSSLIDSLPAAKRHRTLALAATELQSL
eukprot:jgi/Chlat1/7493/Chrsp61S07015